MFIDQVQVFSGESAHNFPCVLMHVRQPLTLPSEGSEDVGRVDEHDENGIIVNTHMIMAKL